MPLVLRKELAYKKLLAERAAIASKLYFEENKSRNEIATALGVGLSTVDRILRSIPDYKAKQRQARISEETKQKVVELYRQGFSAMSIAEHLGGFTGASAYKIVRKLAPELLVKEKVDPITGTTKKGSRVTDEQKALIFQLYKDGLKYASIGEKVNLSTSTVGNVLKGQQRRIKPLPAPVAAAMPQVNPDDVKGTVIKLHEDYHSIEEIAAKLEIPKTQVEHIISTHRHTLK